VKIWTDESSYICTVLIAIKVFIFLYLYAQLHNYTQRAPHSTMNNHLLI